MKAEKKCNGCNLILPRDSFAKKGKYIQSKCKNCHNHYQRWKYKNNINGFKDKTLKSVRKLEQLYITENKEYVWNVLSNSKCMDCHEKDPVVLEFDHRDRKDKISTISYLMSQKHSIKSLIKEIKKCDIVCANCHRKRTAKTFNYWKYKRNMGA